MQRSLHKTNLTFIFLASLMVGGCAEMPKPRGKPVAEQTFAHFQSMPLRAAKVDVQQLYAGGTQDTDISNSLILPPHIAIMNYANTRFRPSGGMDTFRFVLEKASVTKKVIQASNQALRWTGLANDEEFLFDIEVSLQRISPSAMQGPGVTLNIERTLVIPERKSIAEREARQTQFVEQLVRDLDVMALEALRDHMDLL